MKLHRTCDGMQRRDMLKAGVLSIGGLTLSNYMQMVSCRAGTGRPRGPGNLYRIARWPIAFGHIRYETGRGK